MVIAIAPSDPAPGDHPAGFVLLEASGNERPGATEAQRALRAQQQQMARPRNDMQRPWVVRGSLKGISMVGIHLNQQQWYQTHTHWQGIHGHANSPPGSTPHGLWLFCSCLQLDLSLSGVPMKRKQFDLQGAGSSNGKATDAILCQFPHGTNLQGDLGRSARNLWFGASVIFGKLLLMVRKLASEIWVGDVFPNIEVI